LGDCVLMAYGKVRVDQVQSSTRTVDVDSLATTAVATQSVAGLLSATDKTKLDGVAAGAEVNVNADWTASSGDTQILNKPTLGTAAATAATDYATAAQGVTNGNSHDHNGGDGAQITYSSLSGTPTLGTAAAKNVGTASGNVVELDGSARLPAVDGSQLTGINTAGTDLTYTAATRLLASSTGTDATLPLFTNADAGLAPASSGGTANFLRADGTFAAPPGGSTDLTYTAATRVLSSSTGSGVTLPVFASGVAGLVPAASSGGTTTFLRADGTFATAGSPPGGSDTQVQFNDDGDLGGSADLTWDDTGKVLEVGGDINLDDGGTYETTLQVVTPTANRTISFPDATGTVALVGGSSGQLLYNASGANAGTSTITYDGTNVTLSGRFISSLNGAASAPPGTFTGTWFTGGTSTTTKPQVVIEPTGSTSTAWSTSGTGLGVNASSVTFAGLLLDLQANASTRFSVSGLGVATLGGSATTGAARTTTAPARLYVGTGTWTDNTTAASGTATHGTIVSFDNPAIAASNATVTYTNASTVYIDGAPTNGTNVTITNAYSFFVNAGTSYFGGDIQIADTANIVLATGTGTKIGTATTQKLGFFDKAPVVQPIAVADATTSVDVITQFNALLARMRDLGLIAT
jgi:hypothetical protein